MGRAFPAFFLALGAALVTSSAAAHRSFPFTEQSLTLGAGTSEIEPWTTFRAGRERYYSAVDGQLSLEHGLAPRLQLGLSWLFSSETRDVLTGDLTGEIRRSNESELAGASMDLHYQLSDATADLLGSALELEAALGARESMLGAGIIVDRNLERWKVAANLAFECELASVRDAEGSDLETAVTLEPTLAVAYELSSGFGLGLELRAPLGLGDGESSTLFGGPVVNYDGSRFWATLGVEPQLVAFTGQTPSSRLDLHDHERLELRLRAGFAL
jgi:hypothetical protein